jgi:hypothetical protein
MVERNRQLVRERIHEESCKGLTCHAPTAEDIEAVYWMKNKQWFSFDDGKAVFKPGTPQRVLDSYKLWSRDNIH